MCVRSLSFALFLICGAPTFAGAESAPDPTLTDAEFAELVTLLDNSQAALLGLISGLSDEQWNFKQNPDRWSVAECTEHIVRSQRAQLETVRRILASPRDPDWASKTEGKAAVIRQLVPMRGPQGQGGVQAPEEIRPTEGWDRGRAIREVYATQGEVRAFIETMDRRINDHTQESSIRQLGWMNAYDWLTLLSMHIVRHSKQIIEVQESPNYPKRAWTPGAR